MNNSETNFENVLKGESKIEIVDKLENLRNQLNSNTLKGRINKKDILKSIDEIINTLWKPLIYSFPDLERRDNLIIGGSFQNRVYVSTVGHLTGTFANPWLGVPSNGKTIHLRICEVHQIENEKIINSHILIDIMDFIRQAGFWPINPSLGIEEMWPGPITGDGVTFENLDSDLSSKNLNQNLTMQRSLNIKPETEFGSTKDSVREKLINHPQKDYWHPKMMWYGPCGIGTARGLKGFVEHHQLPFRLTFKERDYWKIGHYIEIGDGNYSMTGGWHSIQATHGSSDWLGYEATQKIITMRVMDFYLHNEGLIRENWVPIDIAHILFQLDVDVLKLIHKE